MLVGFPIALYTTGVVSLIMYAVQRDLFWYRGSMLLLVAGVVRPDGTISLPLVGDLRVTGRTPGQVQAELVQRMATFIKDESAIVTVAPLVPVDIR